MTERDPIERCLRLARGAAWAPEAARARVRSNLARGLPSAANAARAGGVTKLTTALLVGAGFVAGYWLGVQRSAGPRETLAVSAASPLVGPAAPAAPRVDASAERTATAASATPNASAASPEALPDIDRARAAPAPSEVSPPADLWARPLADSSRDVPALRRPRAATSREPATPGPAVLARASAPSNDPAAAELALLSRAERAIRAGEPALALSFLDELEMRFPSSTLLEERVAARLLAECALSNPGARQSAELFLRDRAASVYTDRVRRSCGIEAPPASVRSRATDAADGSSKSGH